jgi:hypothetical protein
MKRRGRIMLALYQIKKIDLLEIKQAAEGRGRSWSLQQSDVVKKCPSILKFFSEPKDMSNVLAFF